MKREILEPKAVTKIVPAAQDKVWLYRYTNPAHGWTLSISTHGAPQSGKLSLGGFRIVPEARAALPGFNADKEAIELGLGMEEKVFWSRTCKVGGPLGLQNLDRIVGGKCVLLPSKGSRVGEARDTELLSWAVDCLKDFEGYSGVFLVTGQDLGHGMMSDGNTSSLEFLNSNFPGSIIADTGKPTGEGNYRLMMGALRGLGVEPEKANIGVVGFGNIGEHLLERITETKDPVQVLEASAEKRERIQNKGIKTWAAEQKFDFLREPFDALAFNALGGSLDAHTIKAICENKAIKFVSGCENLIMPDPAGEKILRDARKIYCHTELCGMMGYLTAVECYLCAKADRPFVLDEMYPAAFKLTHVGERASALMLEKNYSISFEDAVRSLEW